MVQIYLKMKRTIRKSTFMGNYLILLIENPSHFLLLFTRDVTTKLDNQNKILLRRWEFKKVHSQYFIILKLYRKIKQKKLKRQKDPIFKS